MLAVTIYPSGYGDILETFLRGVKYIFTVDDFIGIAKIILVISLILVLLSILRRGEFMNLIKFYVVAIGIWTLFMQAKTDVVIDESPIGGTIRNVQDVPWAVAKPLAFFDMLERKISESMEYAIGLPSWASVKSGLLSPYGIMVQSNNWIVRDQYLHQTINEFILNCVFPGINEGSIPMANVMNESINIWNQFANVNPARLTMVYTSQKPQGTLMNCQNAYKDILTRIQSYVTTRGYNEIAYALGYSSGTLISSMLGVAPQELLNYQSNASTYLMHAIGINHFKLSGELVSPTGDTTGVAIGMGNIERQLESSGALTRAVAGRYLPVIKGILVCILVGLTPVLFLLLLTPMFTKVLWGYFTILLWLALWRVGDVVLNAIIFTKANGYFSNFNYSMLTNAIVNSSILDYIAMAGSLYWLIPTIGMLLATGFSIYTMSSLAGSMSGTVDSMENAQAAAVATGSFSAGNISMGNSTFWGQSWGNRAIGNVSEFNYSGYNVSRDNISEGVITQKIAGGRIAIQGGQKNSQGYYIQGSGTADELTVDGRTLRNLRYEMLGDGSVRVTGTTMKDGRPIEVSGIATGVRLTDNGFEVSEGAKFTAQTETDIGKWMGIVDIVNQYYGGDMGKFAQTLIANDAAIARAFGGDVGRLIDFLTKSKIRDIGTLRGQVAAYDEAVKHGFKGSMEDWFAFTSEVQATRAYADAQTWEHLAQKYYGGDKNAMFESLALYHNTRAVAALQKLAEHGYDSETAAQYVGHINALRNLGQIKGYRLVGDSRMIGSTAMRDVLNPVADFEVKTQMAKALGLMRDDNDLRGFFNYLKQSHGQDTVTLNATMAKNLNEFMHKQGYGYFNAKAGDQVSFALDPTTGKITVAHAERGGRVEKYNLTTGRTGVDNLHLDINMTRVGRGPEIENGLFTAATDPMALANLLSPHMSREKRNQIYQKIAAAIAKDLPISRTGISLDSFEGKANVTAHAGVGITGPVRAGVGVQGSAGISGQRTDRKEIELLTQELYTMLSRRGEEIFTDKHLTPEQKRQLFAAEIHEVQRVKFMEYTGDSPENYGASAVPEAVKKATEKAGKLLGIGKTSDGKLPYEGWPPNTSP